MLAHKVTLNSSFNLAKSITVNPSFIYGGKRYAYTELDENGEGIASEVDPYLLANLFLNFKNFLPGFTGGFGVYDLLDAQPVLPQAYNGGYLPIPGRGREYVIKLSCKLDFKK